MKLYTEEQVRKAIHIKSNNIDLLTSDDILGSLTPIELPSDEEIQEGIVKSLFISPNPEYKIFNAGTKAGFTNGAKWVIEQIKQQDNGK